MTAKISDEKTPPPPRAPLNRNHAATLVAILLLALIAAVSGYRFHLSPWSISFEPPEARAKFATESTTSIS
jgi:hypothetical protein